MVRRQVYLTLVVACALLAPSAHAATTCQPTPQGALCTSQVDFLQFAETAFMTQEASQWCWAASLSMVFSYYQHPLSQQRIVIEVYGGVQNIPANGYVIASKLNGCFVDDTGAKFSSKLVAAYDADAGVNAISNPQIISALDKGQPLVIGTHSHAMVLTAIQYYQTPAGPNVVAAGVFDPWPGQGPRSLQMDELYPAQLGGSLRFLALPRITDDCAVQPPAPPAPLDPGDEHMAVGCQSSVTRTNGSGMLGLVVALGALRWRRRRSPC